MRDYVQKYITFYRTVVSVLAAALVIADWATECFFGMVFLAAGMAALGLVQDRLMSKKHRNNPITSAYMGPIYVYYAFRWAWRGCPKINWSNYYG